MAIKAIDFLLLLILTQGAHIHGVISPSCRAKVAQVLCSIHHHDQLRLCIDGAVADGAIFKNENIESYCFTQEDDKCVTEKLCSVTIKEVNKPATTTTQVPQVEQEVEKLQTIQVFLLLYDNA